MSRFRTGKVRRRMRKAAKRRAKREQERAIEQEKSANGGQPADAARKADDAGPTM